MSDWQKIKLEDVCSKVTDGTHDSPITMNSGDYPLIKGKDISGGYINFENCDFISKADHLDVISRSKPEYGDILFSNIGSVSDCAYINTHREFSIKNVALFKPDKDIVDSKFLFYIVNSDQFKGEILNKISGSAQPFASLSLLRNHKIKLPKLQTQKKISKILSIYDNLIANNLDRIKLLEISAKLTYEEWFLRFRIDDIKLDIDPDTALPKGWEWKLLKDFGEVVTGKTPSTNNKSYYGGNIPFIKTPSMHGSPYTLEVEDYLTYLGANTQRNKFLTKNSLMVSCIGTAGVYSLVARECQTNQQINSIKFYKNYYIFYIYCFAGYLKDVLDSIGSNGATMTNVNKGKFEKIKVAMPSVHLLERFHKTYSLNFESILNLMKINQLLNEVKEILIPRLMTGIIDIDKVDI